MNHQRTLGNKDWLNQNEEKLRSIFPATWTHAANLDNLGIQLMYRLKLLDVHIQEHELAAFLAFCEKSGVLIRNGLQIRRNHICVTFNSVFGQSAEESAKESVDNKDPPSSGSNPVGQILRFLLFTSWISGFVFAKGFWSTLACVIPFWAWYLTLEKVFEVIGWIA